MTAALGLMSALPLLEGPAYAATPLGVSLGLVGALALRRWIPLNPERSQRALRVLSFGITGVALAAGLLASRAPWLVGLLALLASSWAMMWFLLVSHPDVVPGDGS